MRLLDPYTPPMTLPGIDLDLSRNEGQPPDMSILDEVSGEPGLLNRYPDSSGLRDKVSKLRDVSPEATLVTAGGDDALLRCCAALLTAGTRTVTTTPTFEMIARYSALQGADLVEVPWKNGPFPTDRLVGSAEAGAVCLIVSPNNPTGEVIGSEDLLELAEAFEYVVLDGAYMEFAAVDLTRDALQQPNVLMLRTLSKAWGLAGLRVGYLLGEPSLVRRVSAFGNPYPVSRLSLAIAEKRLEAGDVDDFIHEVCAERNTLTDLFARLGLEPIESQANFVFAETSAAEYVRSALADAGIAIRTFPGRPGLERALRVTLPGVATDFERLVGTLEKVLRRDQETRS